MFIKTALSLSLILSLSFAGFSQEEEKESTPIELDVLKASLGVWDAEIEVWPQGLDSPSIKFKGVETNRPYGKHWIASDFNSEYGGQTIKVHSIVGYDLDRKKLVGKVIDDGPYAAAMTGDYDKESKTVQWMTKVKSPTGAPIVQKTSIKHTSPDERVLVLSVPGEQSDEFKKFMQIKFVKRK